jgi:hypothetical protein
MAAAAAVDLREHALRIAASAGTAPSHHNAQPWAFRVDAGSVEVWADPTRQLGVADPEGRQMLIGVGAALYVVRLELAELGAANEVELLPDPGQPELAAVVRVTGPGGATADTHALWRQLPRRRTVRHRMRSDLEPAVRQMLAAQVAAEGATLHWVDALADRRSLASLVVLAEHAQQRDPVFLQELADWVGAEALAAGGGVPEYAMGPAAAAGYAAELPLRDFAGGRQRPQASTHRPERHPVVAVLTTGMDQPADWLRAGEGLVRMLLAATGQGLAASFFNQPLEGRGFRAQGRAELALPGAPQLILRVGRPTGVWPPATPRRPPAELLLGPLRD